MKSINCEIVLSLRDDYLQSGNSEAIVESHLVECAACLDSFIEVALTMPPSIAPAETFAMPVRTKMKGTPEMAGRRIGIIATSTVLGGAAACMTSLLLGDTATPLHSIIASGEIFLAGAILIEFTVLLLLPETVRAG